MVGMIWPNAACWASGEEILKGASFPFTLTLRNNALISRSLSKTTLDLPLLWCVPKPFSFGTLQK